jgi:hypothetical protein
MKEVFNTIPEAIGVLDLNGATFANNEFIALMQPHTKNSVNLLALYELCSYLFFGIVSKENGEV